MAEAENFQPPANPGDTLRRVLVIKLGGMGDFVQAMGAMRVVRATHQSARITLLTTPPFEAFAKACPYFDIVETDGRPADIRGRTDLTRRLKQAGYDMVYDFENTSRTLQYFQSMGSKKPLWSGSAEGASHEHRNYNRESMHNFDRLADQLLHAGLTPQPEGDPTGWIIGQQLNPYLDWIRPAFRDPPRFQPEYFSLYGPYALLMPGISGKSTEGGWPLEHFVEVANWLAEGGITPVVIGSRAEGDIGMKINREEQRAKNLVGRTDLFQLATLCERAVVAVGGATGPMHFAAAARTPSVCLFSQKWNSSMELELQTIWNPQTKLGRTAPRGGPMMVVYAANLKDISVQDVATNIVRLDALPTRLELPKPREVALPTEDSGNNAADDTDAISDENAADDVDTKNKQEFAQSGDS